jgi:hypothetical protein
MEKRLCRRIVQYVLVLCCGMPGGAPLSCWSGAVRALNKQGPYLQRDAEANITVSLWHALAPCLSFLVVSVWALPCISPVHMCVMHVTTVPPLTRYGTLLQTAFTISLAFGLLLCYMSRTAIRVH